MLMNSRRATSSVLSEIKKVGCLVELTCIRAKYSPIIPSATNWAPEKMEMIEARNEKPGTILPSLNQFIITYPKTIRPKAEKNKAN